MNKITKAQLEYSDTAKRLGIKNKIPESLNHNVEVLLMYLNRIQSITKQVIHISSGYRCYALNKAIGGSTTSQHVKGQAADIVLDDSKALRPLFNKIKDIIPYTQLIFEEHGGKIWIHYAIDENDIRMETMEYKNGIYKHIY